MFISIRIFEWCHETILMIFQHCGSSHALSFLSFFRMPSRAVYMAFVVVVVEEKLLVH